MIPPRVRTPRRTAAWVVRRFGHPLLLVGAGLLWWHLGAGELALALTLVAVIVTIELLQRLVPAMPAWGVSVRMRLTLVGLYLLTFGVSGLLIGAWGTLLGPGLAGFRASTAQSLWPHAWPWPLQAALLALSADFIYYWVHRAIHRWPLLWRLSGHGFHHAFHKLGALNAGSNHPLELVLVVLPLVLLAAAFGPAQLAVSAAGLFLIVNAILAHANISMATPGLSLVVTTSDQHRLHHSVDFAQSNANYACNCILWDRLFGSYAAGDVRQTGIGPTQPGLKALFLLPLREPADADTVATRGAHAADS